MISTAIAYALVITYAEFMMNSGGLYYFEWAQDIFVPLEGILHIERREWPSIGFHSPVGVLYFLVHYMAAMLAPLSARTIIVANLIVAIVGVTAVTVTMAGKISPLMRVVLSVYVGLVALSPRQIGENFLTVSQNASYNRYGWCLICIVALSTLIAGQKYSKTRVSIDAAVTGIVLAALLFLKVTYFLAGIGFVALSIITTRQKHRVRFIAIALMIPMAAILLTVLLSAYLQAYVNDLVVAGKIAPLSSRGKSLFYVSKASLPALVAVCVVQAICVLRFGLVRGAWSRPFAAGILTIAAGVAIGLQNNPEPENLLCPIALAVVWAASGGEEQLQSAGLDSRAAMLRHSLSLGVAGAFLIVFGAPLAADILSAAWTLIAPVDRTQATAWLAQTPLGDLRVARRPVRAAPLILESGPGSDAELLEIIGDGVALVRRHVGGRNDARVLSLTYTNPFPVLLGLPPVSGELAWWDNSRTFTQTIKPDGRALLAKVDYVMIARQYCNPDVRQAMEAAYRGDLRQQFAVVDHSMFWTILARRDCALRKLC